MRHPTPIYICTSGIQAKQINPINWIAKYIPIKIRITTRKSNRVSRCPPSRLWIVVTITKANQAGVIVF
jgi:hypothetical protein